MALVDIGLFAILALAAGWVGTSRLASARGWLLLAGSLLAVYWLQPISALRNLDFWLPTLSLLLAGAAWAFTQTAGISGMRPELRTVLVSAGVVLGIGLLRYTGPVCCLSASRPPQAAAILLVLALAAALILVPLRLNLSRRRLQTILIVLLLLLFLILKSDSLAEWVSALLRRIAGQDPALASPLDLRWLGYSYLAFRLVHVLRDAQDGRLPASNLKEFLTYALFFPALTAGPIDRIGRFVPELRQDARFNQFKANCAHGAQRIITGMFKKFVLADALALVSLSAQNAPQAAAGLWLWVLLYTFALRIYFDFSGYTDIAIGLGQLAGIRLPENFEQPYRKTNLTAFWNTWHITLAQWFRAYYFFPVTRWLRQRSHPTWAVILVGQFSTMLLIGLWHGFTWNFAIWGAWHGLGLFIHNRWSDWQRSAAWEAIALQLSRLPGAGKPWAGWLSRFAAWFITFNYVSLGWVWFALPTPALALSVFHKLAAALMVW